MTREEFADELREHGFAMERDGEFNRDVFTNGKFPLTFLPEGVRCVFDLTIYVDYYTVRIVWQADARHRYGYCYYVAKELHGSDTACALIADFIYYCSMTYGIDIHGYKE